jgi:hypothetical protein
MVGLPFASAILPTNLPKMDCVSLYVIGLTTSKKMNAENIEILHFLELDGPAAAICIYGPYIFINYRRYFKNHGFLK